MKVPSMPKVKGGSLFSPDDIAYLARSSSYFIYEFAQEKDEEENGTLHFVIPEVKDEDVKIILDFVWKRYRGVSTPDMINLLHKENTPWAYCYRVGKNVEIPDEMTKVYYSAIVNSSQKQ